MSTEESSRGAPIRTASRATSRRGNASHHVLSQLDALMATNYLHPTQTNQIEHQAEAYGETKTGDSELTYTQDSVDAETYFDDADQLRSSSSFTPLASMPLAEGIRSNRISSPSSSSSPATAAMAGVTTAMQTRTPSTKLHHDRAVTSSFDQWKRHQSQPSPSSTTRPRTPGTTTTISPSTSRAGVYSTNNATGTTAVRTKEEEADRWGQFLNRVQLQEKEKQKYGSPSLSRSLCA